MRTIARHLHVGTIAALAVAGILTLLDSCAGDLAGVYAADGMLATAAALTVTFHRLPWNRP